FRTLTKRDLNTYLPKTVSTVGYGTHLNLALPLHQPLSTQDQETGEAARIRAFRDLLHAADPLLQNYYRSSRRAFFDLKHSNDPKLKEYYYSIMLNRKRLSDKTKNEKTRTKALLGY